MKFTDFLKLLTTEKFSFKVDYIEWSNEIKVTVDTFSRVEIYKFNDSRVTEYTELQEVLTTEDKSIIEQKLRDLVDRPLKTWIEASVDLKIKFLHPHKFIGVDGHEYEATGLLPDFGQGKGTLITSRKDDDEVFKMAELTNDYYLSALNPYHYDKYDRNQIIETLSDWGWIGKEGRPDWIVSS
jgi:hypothetical protein